MHTTGLLGKLVQQIKTAGSTILAFTAIAVGNSRFNDEGRFSFEQSKFEQSNREEEKICDIV